MEQYQVQQIANKIDEITNKQYELNRLIELQNQSLLKIIEILDRIDSKNHSF